MRRIGGRTNRNGGIAYAKTISSLSSWHVAAPSTTAPRQAAITGCGRSDSQS